MGKTRLSDELLRAEGLLVQGQQDSALELLARLAEDAEEYVDRNCPTTDELQWFSFPTLFERLAYRRVERDPRELRDVGEPLDRLYADLALANVRCGDYEAAPSRCARRFAGTPWVASTVSTWPTCVGWTATCASTSHCPSRCSSVRVRRPTSCARS